MATAQFKGGPLDGTTRQLEEATPTFEVKRLGRGYDQGNPNVVPTEKGIYDRRWRITAQAWAYVWRGWQ